MPRFPPALAVLALLGIAAAAPAWDHHLVPGQKAFGTISVADEEDEVLFRGEAGKKVTFTLKRRTGQALLPVFTKVLDPGMADLLGSTVLAKTNARGTVTTVRFVVPTAGTWVLGISGASSTTGTWDLVSRGPPKIPLGSGTIASPGAEGSHSHDLDIGTVATVQAKAATGSLLRPSIARVEMPFAEGDLDLGGVARTVTKRSDTLKRLPLNRNGTWSFVVTGAEGTTGAYHLTLKVVRKVPLDFTVDPTPGPPPLPAPQISTVTPPTAVVPAEGTESKAFTVAGANFMPLSTVSISAGAGTSGISNVAATFNSQSSLSVTYDLSSTATPGARDVTVTNPDLQAATEAGGLTLQPPPSFAVTSVTPNHGDGAGGQQVVVQGAAFPAASKVTFGGLPAGALNRVDSGSILCVVPPAAAVSAAGGTAVDVVVDDGTGVTVTLAGGYTYDIDPNPPIVSTTVPAPSATGVPRSLLTYVFVLSEPAAPGTVAPGAGFDWFGATLQDVPSPRVSSVGPGPGNRFVVVKRNASVALLAPANAYNVDLPKSVTDTAGNPLDPIPFGGNFYRGTFTTHAANADAVAPTVAATLPANGTSGNPVDGAVVVTFSEAVDPTTLAGAVAFALGPTPVPFDLSLDATCTVATLVPRGRLSPGSGHTVSVGTGLLDLSGNALAAGFAASFITAVADTLAPVQTLTVDRLPQDQNGSLTYVPGNSNGGAPTVAGPPTAFNAYLPRSGFTIDVPFSDAGGSGVDPSSFSCTCSAAMGGVGAGGELASLFAVSPLEATWTVDASHALAAGTNITFTVNVSDYGGNAAAAKVLAVDVADITRTINNNAGTPSTDRDPFNARQSWLLRFDQDVWTISASAGTPLYQAPIHSKPITILSTANSNLVSDFQEDLSLLGLNGAESGTGASTVTNGPDTGTNAIVRTMVRKAVRGHLNQRYGIAFDGTRSAGSVDIEFLLDGETKAGGGTVSPGGWSPSSGFSMMTFTGEERAITPAAMSLNGTIGRANFDLRNRSQDDDSNDGVGGANNVGTFATHMIRLRINDQYPTEFPQTFDPLISLASRGGTPVGASNDDAVVLDDTFDYAAATAPRKARFDRIMRAVDRYALFLSMVGAHEIGHSTGLVADGPPPLGLFGNAHPNNTFVVSSANTSSAHVDTVGSNLMSASLSFTDSIVQGSSFTAFEPMSLAYLLRRFLYDQ